MDESSLFQLRATQAARQVDGSDGKGVERWGWGGDREAKVLKAPCGWTPSLSRSMLKAMGRLGGRVFLAIRLPYLRPLTTGDHVCIKTIEDATSAGGGHLDWAAAENDGDFRKFNDRRPVWWETESHGAPMYRRSRETGGQIRLLRAVVCGEIW